MRRTAFSAAFLVLSTLALGSGVASQTQSAPAVPPGAARPGAPAGQSGQPGQPAAPAKVPTAVIKGSVTAAVGGRALGGVQISMQSAQPVIPGGVTVAPRETRNVATDPDGRFEIPGLPAGRYRISAAKTGYVRMDFGARAWDEPGTQIEVADGQIVEHIDFALPRGGVIVVTATNPRGEPLAGAEVQALQYRFTNGRRSLQPTVYVTTNDLGQARLHGLSPGEYFVSANAAFGTVGAANAKMSYAPTYYPGTFIADEAQRVTVSIAQETSIVIPLVKARLATVTGRAVKADGSPISYTPPVGPTNPNDFGLGVVMRQEMPGGGFMQRNLTTKSDGSFSVPNLLPGKYEFQVRPLGNLQAFRGTSEFAQMPVTIGGEDVPNLEIVSRPGAKITGQVKFDTGSPPTDKTLNEMRVFVYSNMVDTPLSAGLVTMNPDYSFEIAGVAMTGMVRMAVANTGWNVKEEIVDGKDIVESPIAFEPGREYKDVQVLLTQKRAEVVGSATDGAGRPVMNYVALVFPQDRERWVPRSLSILQARSDQNGQFRIQRLPGAKYGSYNVIALDSLQPGEEMDFELLARLAPLATKITVGETEVKTVTLKVQEKR